MPVDTIRRENALSDKGIHFVGMGVSGGEEGALNGPSIMVGGSDHAYERLAPVVVLTTTDDQREIQRCYDLGANVYITKPVEYETFSQAIRQLGLFLSVIQIPEAS